MNNEPSVTTSARQFRSPETVTEAVVDAIAEAKGVSPLALEPLTAVIDPDALNALFRGGRAGTVAFAYQEYRVHVSLGERVDVKVFDD